MLSQSYLRDLKSFHRALGDVNRLRAVQILATEGDLNVSELVRRLHISQPLMSWHLRRLTRAGLIVEATEQQALEPVSWPRRSRRVYRITAEGKERLAELLSEAGPQAWDDEGFGVHLAFFRHTPDEKPLVLDLFDARLGAPPVE